MTQEVQQRLKGLKDAIYEAWGNGGYTTESADGTVQANANAIGQIQGLNEFLNLTWEEFDE